MPHRQLPPGQQAILRSFAANGRDSIYVCSDVLDLRVCCAMAEKGLIRRIQTTAVGFELTPAGAALAFRGVG